MEVNHGQVAKAQVIQFNNLVKFKKTYCISKMKHFKKHVTKTTDELLLKTLVDNVL